MLSLSDLNLQLTEQVNICKLLHLLDITFRLYDFLIIEQNPCFPFLWNLFANKGHIMPTSPPSAKSTLQEISKKILDLPRMDRSSLMTYNALQTKPSWHLCASC